MGFGPGLSTREALSEAEPGYQPRGVDPSFAATARQETGGAPQNKHAMNAVGGERRRRRRLGPAALLALSLAAACTGARLDRAQDVGAGPGGVTPTSGGAAGSAGATGTTAAGTAAPGAPGAGGAGTGGANGTGGAGDTAGGGAATGGPTGSDPGSTGPAYVSSLFTADEDQRGITPDEIRLCAHAALTYGAAFNTGADDLNVYWTAVNEAGGVYGRKVHTYYENDNYTPEDAIKAATACRDKYDPFMLIGGIGFDQIPAVREWAEQNHMLYFHHTATTNGSAGKQYSYTALPTTEKAGEMFAELAVSRFPGKKVGIIKRQSENWEPGVDGFKRLAAQHGIDIVLDRPVPQNKGSYLQDIVDLHNAGAEVVWLWLNALETTTFIKQAKAQQQDFAFMVFPFNLTTQTLGNDALTPPIVGIAMWNAYSEGDYSGAFAEYADDMKLFEAQYRKYDPSVDVGGVGGDLLFLNWSAQKAMHQLLLQCGPDCTRNRLLGLLHGYDQRVTSSTCAIDFSRPGADNDHRGGWAVSVLEAYRAPTGKVNLRNVATCVEHLI